MIGLLVDLVVGGLFVYAFVAFVVLAAVMSVVALGVSILSGLKDCLGRRGVSPLRWSRSADEIARALTGEQAVAFSIRWRSGVRARHLEFMLVPLDNLPELEKEVPERGQWHVFCPDLSSACTAVLPWSGLELARKLKIPASDTRAGAEAFDAVMSRMVGLLWGAG